MKKIIFLILISLQVSYLRSMQSEAPITIADMPNEILYKMALDIIMPEIAKAKTINEVDNAYKALAGFARTNKQHLAIANDVKKDKAVVNASKKRKLEIIQEILNKKSKEYSHFNIAENGIDAKKVKDFQGGDLGDTALIEAAYRGHPGIALLLFVNGANVNEKNANGWTALMMAANRNRKDMVRLLLDKGANANAVNKHGNTAYDLAKASGNTDIMDILIQKMK
jgi:hypothetical protein